MSKYQNSNNWLFEKEDNPVGRRARRRLGLKPKKQMSKRNENKPKDDSIDTPKKERLETAHNIIDRILHDPEIDEKEYLVLYEDRFLNELQEKTIEEWLNGLNSEQGGGRIPEHRIQAIKHLTEGIKWDRQKRINLF